MTHGEMLKEVARLSEQLYELMQNPEPGLFTWHQAVGRVLDQLAEFAPSYEKLDA